MRDEEPSQTGKERSMTIDQILKGRTPSSRKIDCEGCGKVTTHHYEGYKFSTKMTHPRGAAEPINTEKMVISYKCSKCSHMHSYTEKRKVPEDSKQSREYPHDRRNNGNGH